MTVAEIKKNKAHTVKIIFSDNAEAIVDIDVLSEFPMHKGEEINEEQLLKIKERSDFLRAKSKALWLLDRSDRTERQIYDNLKKSGFALAPSQKAVEQLKSYGLLDDRRFAENYVRKLTGQGKSRKEIFFKLMQKGVSKEIANEVLSGSDTDESKQLELLIEKKYKLKLQSKENTDKVFASLARKGFSYAQIKAALKKYLENCEFEENYGEF